MNIHNYNKIILVGSSGSGKSWFAKRIAELTNYPLYHLDVEFWQPNWVMPPKEWRIARQQEMIIGEQWIIEGNYNSTMELRYVAADLVIFMDINRWVCMWAAARRTGKKRSDLPEYLEESSPFSKEFLAFCKWIWQYPKDGRKTVMDLYGKYPNTAFLQVQSRREVRKWLSKWEIQPPTPKRSD